MSTQHFEVVGGKLPTLAAASERALLLFNELADRIDAVCIEAHFSELDVGHSLAAVIPSDRFSCYCWSEFADSREFTRPEFESISQARIQFGNTSILIQPTGLTEPYDWDGRAHGTCAVVLETKHFHPLKDDEREPSHRVKETFASVVEGLAAAPPQSIGTTSSWREEFRAHRYSVTVPVSRAAMLTRELCLTFGLSNGVGSYEFLGRMSQIESIHKGGHYSFHDFPQNCWRLNAPLETAFALGAQGFLFPELNLEIGSLLGAAGVLDKLRDKIARAGMIRKYLSWKLCDGTFSPRVQGNYLLISQQKSGGYAISLGFERYEDKDPTARQFTSFATPVIEGMGAHLKKATAPR